MLPLADILRSDNDEALYWILGFVLLATVAVVAYSSGASEGRKNAENRDLVDALMASVLLGVFSGILWVGLGAVVIFLPMFGLADVFFEWGVPTEFAAVVVGVVAAWPLLWLLRRVLLGWPLESGDDPATIRIKQEMESQQYELRRELRKQEEALDDCKERLARRGLSG